MTSTTATALGIAIVGVLGTLLAPIVSQKLSAQARREEFEQQRVAQLDEYRRQQTEQIAAAKRSCYLGLFTASRRYRVELMNYLFTVNREEVNELAQSQLEEARVGFMASISETQLTGSLAVMDALSSLRHANSKAYGNIKNLERGNPERHGSFEEIRTFIYAVWDEEWPRVVKAVRADLGIED